MGNKFQPLSSRRTITSITAPLVVDRASVPSPIAIEILMVHNGEGQSSHVLVFCVNLELLEIISFTLKSNYYVYIAVLSLQYICC